MTRIKQAKDYIAEAIINDIAQGILKKGDKIVEQFYAEKFGISRTPVREAIRSLEQTGLIEYIPRKGVVVRKLTKNNIEEISEIRIALETLLVKKIIEKCTDKDISTLKKIVNNMHISLENKDYLSLRNYINDYHEEFYNIAKMPFLEKITNELILCTRIFREKNITLGSNRTIEATKEHTKIYESIAERNVEQAQYLTIKHITNATNKILEII